MRAALASAVFLVINQWIHSVPLTIASTGALITCFCDSGGTLRQRLPMLLAFTALGALTWGSFGLLRQGGIGLVVPFAGLAVFLFSMARVWGLRAQTVGNIAIVVLALAIDRPLSPSVALAFSGAFAVGGLWACLLTLVIWRIQPDRPAHRAVGAVWATMADLVADLRSLAGDSTTTQDRWEAHARGHRRAVRTAIENARAFVSTSIRSRGLVSGRGSRDALMLEIAEQLFGEMIILSELLETVPEAAGRERSGPLLRRLQRIFRVLAGDGRPDPARIGASLDRILLGDRGVPPVDDLTTLIVDRLRVVLRVLEHPETVPFTTIMPPRSEQSWRERVWMPLRGEMTWSSAILRHAVRATILTVPAIAITLVWWTPYAHWLTITVALTMQPFFAATWQRALERIAGTLLGALIGGALAFLPQTPLVLGGALLPLSVLGFSVRQVSYGAYIACLTPLIVLLFDIVDPGHSAATVAGMRTLYTLVGGVIAVGACMILWPSWEPRRLQQELSATLRAYAGLAVAVLRDPAPARAIETERARRAAGLANNNFEASLSRALQEPGGHNTDLLRIVAADAILRRLGATLLAVPHDPLVRSILQGGERHRWETYFEAAFSALAAGQTTPASAPEAPPDSTLQRVRRGLDALSADLAQAACPAAV